MIQFSHHSKFIHPLIAEYDKLLGERGVTGRILLEQFGESPTKEQCGQIASLLNDIVFEIKRNVARARREDRSL